jgi:hypothetical protein
VTESQHILTAFGALLKPRRCDRYVEMLHQGDDAGWSSSCSAAREDRDNRRQGRERSWPCVAPATCWSSLRRSTAGAGRRMSRFECGARHARACTIAQNGVTNEVVAPVGQREASTSDDHADRHRAPAGTRAGHRRPVHRVHRPRARRRSGPDVPRGRPRLNSRADSREDVRATGSQTIAATDRHLICAFPTPAGSRMIAERTDSCQRHVSGMSAGRALLQRATCP